MNSQLGARQVFQNCKNALRNAGYSADKIENAVLSQSYLRLEQPLNAAGTLFNFPILVNQGATGNNVRATEQRLSLQDGFYISGINIYLALPSSASAVNFKLFSYPNQEVFPTGAVNLPAFYNGQLNLNINQVNIITGFPVYRFWQSKQTQQSATPPPVDQFDGIEDVVVEPNILLLGSNNSVLTIQLPGAIGTLDATTYAVIVLNGIKAQNISTLVA